MNSGSRIIRECEVTTEDGLVGLVVLDGETISAKAANGYEVLMQSILEDPVYVDKKIYRDKDPLAWFEGLPRQYHGSRIWAWIRPADSTREATVKLMALKE